MFHYQPVRLSHFRPDLFCIRWALWHLRYLMKHMPGLSFGTTRNISLLRRLQTMLDLVSGQFITSFLTTEIITLSETHSHVGHMAAIVLWTWGTWITYLLGDTLSCTYPFIYPIYYSYFTFISLCLHIYLLLFGYHLKLSCSQYTLLYLIITGTPLLILASCYIT